MNQFQQKKIQSGRSMVEMLGVLAIIGVLSVGGVAGYRYAMRQFKIIEARDLLNYLVVAVKTENAQETDLTCCTGNSGWDCTKNSRKPKTPNNYAPVICRPNFAPKSPLIYLRAPKQSMASDGLFYPVLMEPKAARMFKSIFLFRLRKRITPIYVKRFWEPLQTIQFYKKDFWDIGSPLISIGMPIYGRQPLLQAQSKAIANFSIPIIKTRRRNLIGDFRWPINTTRLCAFPEKMNNCLAFYLV